MNELIKAFGNIDEQFIEDALDGRKREGIKTKQAVIRHTVKRRHVIYFTSIAACACLCVIVGLAVLPLVWTNSTVMNVTSEKLDMPFKGSGNSSNDTTILKDFEQSREDDNGSDMMYSFPETAESVTDVEENVAEGVVTDDKSMALEPAASGWQIHYLKTTEKKRVVLEDITFDQREDYDAYTIRGREIYGENIYLSAEEIEFVDAGGGLAFDIGGINVGFLTKSEGYYLISGSSGSNIIVEFMPSDNEELGAYMILRNGYLDECLAMDEDFCMEIAAEDTHSVMVLLDKANYTEEELFYLMLSSELVPQDGTEEGKCKLSFSGYCQFYREVKDKVIILDIWSGESVVKIQEVRVRTER